MILYFTGTGNSRYVAERISRRLEDDCEDLFERLRDRNYEEIASDRPFVIVCPTHGWQIPHILRDWLKKAKLSGNRNLYFVMDCGSEIGNAEKYLRVLCREIGMEFRGVAEVVMPENYIAMFDAPEKTEALEIVEAADPVIDAAAGRIAKGLDLLPEHVGAVDRLKSGIVNTAFYKLFVRSDKFTAGDTCTRCGKCVRSCVTRNITLGTDGPVWGGNCTHCMACICGCPEGAIEYGNISRGKPRYQCPK